MNIFNYSIIGIIIIIIFFIIIKTKKRGYFWKVKKTKEQISFKEFIKRWKNGIEQSTGLQQTKIVLLSIIPIVFGLMFGCVISFINKAYWLSIILLASLPITFIQLVQNWQKYKKLKIVEDAFKKLEEGKKDVRR